jgi:NTE family protein
MDEIENREAGVVENGTAPVIGLALGSGSARGWTHIGVIQELEALGVRPQVIAGTSVGALVGAVYVSGQLPAFCDWVRSLTVRDVFGLMDFRLSGGVIKGERLFTHFLEHHENPDIETLPQRFVSIATEMHSGREIWISKGPVLTAARASYATPGLFSPVKFGGQWMLDGGLVNPVPVSACRVHGADIVIAVNLNGQLVGRLLSGSSRQEADTAAGSSEEKGFWHRLIGYFSSGDLDNPGFFDVLTASVAIMQDRITRSRMAGDPADITLMPVLSDYALMDFHRAEEAIEEGRRLVRCNADDICARVGLSRTASPAGNVVPLQADAA